MPGPFKMKGSPMLRNFGIGASPAKQSWDVDEDVKKVISSGKVGGKETTIYTKGGRAEEKAQGGVRPTREKGRHTTYTKQDDDTYTKKVETSPKGARSEAEKKTKKEKTISAKKAERQIKRKTKKAERSHTKHYVKKAKADAKKKVELGYDKKEVKAQRKARIKAIRNR